MKEISPETDKLSPSGKLILGLCLAIAGSGFFSIRAIFVKLAYQEGVGAEVLITWRVLLSLPFYIGIGLFAWYRYQKSFKAQFSNDGKTQNTGSVEPITAKVIVMIILTGLLGYYTASMLDFKGLEYIPAQFGRLILLTYPFFVMLFGALIFGHRLSIKMLPPVLLCYGGIWLIFARNFEDIGNDAILGAALVLGAAIAFALFQLFSRQLVQKVGTAFYTSMAMASASLGVIVHFLITHDLDDLAISEHVFILCLAIALLSTVLPSYLLNGALALVPADKVSMIGNLGPVITIILAVLVLGEIFTWRDGVGAVLVITGIIIFSQLTSSEENT